MSTIENVSRRRFLTGGIIAAGALVLGVRYYSKLSLADKLPHDTNADHATLHPSAYLGIEPDGTVWIVASRSEMGTTSRTTLPLIVADELDADWKRVKIEQGLGDSRYGDQNTDGSHSIRSFYDAMREAGATARLMLIQAAAKQWGVPAGECVTDLHVVVHRSTNRTAGYGELATAAARLPLPKREELKLKPKSAWRYVGKGQVSYDLEALVTGKAIYGMDARMDGMVYASVEHPPVLGGKVKSYDDKEALKVAGVHQTVPIDPFQQAPGFQPLGGIAVIADNTWAAFQGRKKLKVVWDNGPNESYDSADKEQPPKCQHSYKSRSNVRYNAHRPQYDECDSSGQKPAPGGANPIDAGSECVCKLIHGLVLVSLPNALITGYKRDQKLRIKAAIKPRFAGTLATRT